MISYLRGSVIKKTDRAVVLEVGGIGYRVFVTEATRESLPVGGEIALWTHLAVREDSHDLYGFTDEETLGFFELLISISGIGPRSALNILNIVTPRTLRQAVSSGDTSYLTKVSGIGRKIAEKIVIELKDKFEAHDTGDSYSSEHMRVDSDALEALKSLGYPEREAREALKKIASENEKDGKGSTHAGVTMSASEKVKRALKNLGQ